MEQFFQKEGPLQLIFPSYEPRQGQIELSKAIITSMNTGTPLVAEGPTGVGKSLAALIPAILSNRKTLYVTATIALQEQLINKDLPLLSQVFPKLSYGLLKGRSNYLCRRKYTKNATKYRRKDEYDQVITWCKETVDGDFSTLPVKCTFQKHISSTSEDCLNTGCMYSKQCFATSAIKHALGKKIIVTNYHYFLLSNAIVYNYVIADEAHEIADVARSVLGWTLRPSTGKAIIDYFGADPSTVWISEGLDRGMRILFDSTANFIRKESKKRINNPYVDLTELIKVVNAAIERIERRLSELQSQNQFEMLEADKTELARLENLLTQSLNLHYRAQIVMAKTTPGLVRWVTQAENGYLTIEARPLTVHNLLAPWFRKSVCAMSATMKTTDGFAPWRKEVGAPTNMAEVVAVSPFNHKQQAKLVIPKSVPEPNSRAEKAEQERYFDALAQSCAQLINICGGRTLGVFTSWTALRAVRARLRQMGYLVVSQDEVAGKDVVVRSLQQYTCHAALGVRTFRQGVDIPGDALQGVFLDKIPFPQVGDPLEEALGELYGGSKKKFFQRDVPQATLALKQAFGRLIRSVHDRGIVVVADNRLYTRGYGQNMRAALPETPFFRSLDGLTV